MFGWDAEQQKAFCNMQFRLQTKAYGTRFQYAVSYILERHGQAIGRLMLDRNEERMRIIDIVIGKEFRNSGIGTTVLRHLQIEAKIVRQVLSLAVLKTNDRAKHFYEKLGFLVTGENPTHVEMQWRSR